MAKYLARLGWQLTVVTPDPSLWRKVEDVEKVNRDVDREGIGRILTGFRWRCLAPEQLKCWNEGLGWVAGGICRRTTAYLRIDRSIGWIKAAERACSDLAAEDVDVILASSPPFGVFTLAQRLSDRLGRPYVLDYRDLWSKNAHDPMPFARRKEAHLVQGCAAITTVSPTWGLIMQNEFEVTSKLHVIPNGYDPEELTDIKPYDFGHFAIVYTGVFYPPARVISPVMAALRRVKERADGQIKKWCFHYYGPDDNHVREEAERFAIMDRVIIHGNVSRKEALTATRGAGVAVVITSVAKRASLEENGIMTGKVYEALGLGARILSIAPTGSDIRTIDEDSGMARTFVGDDIDGIASFLTDAISDSTARTVSREHYAWPHIAQDMDKVLSMAMATFNNAR
jgi:glycosyltransferase involved in cell wall biosynthesis